MTPERRILNKDSLWIMDNVASVWSLTNLPNSNQSLLIVLIIHAEKIFIIYIFRLIFLIISAFKRLTVPKLRMLRWLLITFSEKRMHKKIARPPIEQSSSARFAGCSFWLFFSMMFFLAACSSAVLSGCSVWQQFLMVTLQSRANDN